MTFKFYGHYNKNIENLIMQPDEDVRLYEQSLRSNVYVSKCGNMYRYYNDTGEWTTILPRMDEHGVMKGLNNKSISRVVAEAWLGVPESCVQIRVKDTTTDPYHVDNLSWPTGCVCYRGTTITKQKKLPKRLQQVHDAIYEGHISSVQNLARNFNVKESTAWTYICQVLCKTTSANMAVNVLDWIYPDCLEFCQEHRPIGTLREVCEQVDEYLREDTNWQKDEHKMSHVRLARICVDILA